MIWLWPVAGVLIGLLNARLLKAAVGRLEAHPTPPHPGRLITGMAGRWLVVAALLAATFRAGIGAGLLALTGFWCARWAMILWWHSKG